jgi:hypothetical protein
LDFDQGLVGPFRSVEDGFELCGRYIVEVAVQAAGVVPVDPAQGGQLDVLDGLPRPGAGGAVDRFGLVLAVHRLSESVVETVTDGPDRGHGTDLSETLAIPNGRKLRPRIGVTFQPRQHVSA